VKHVSAVAAASLALALAAEAQTPAAKLGPFDRLQFRQIGPATMAGRIDDFAVLESNPSVFYVGTATGGVWKTVNNGTTFETVFDKESTSSIGDVAIAQTDANLVWVGTGENNNRQSSSWGEGVFKSTDGGKTWTNMGLRQSRHVARILVDPVDNDIVYVAALGSLWGSGGDRGVFKTSDGGLTWTNVLKTDADTGATELVMDPGNNKVLYAATYQRRRATWGMNGGGPGSAIWKSSDAGRTWNKLTAGIPEGPKGRIGLDVYRKDPNVVYARVEHEKEGGIYRSDDAGASFKKISSVNPRPMYFSQIRVDPQNDARLYVLGVQLHVSDDGGKTFRDDGARQIHVDFHAMWVDPANSNHMLLGGDGGVGISYDRSKTWVFLNNMPLAQYYHVAFGPSAPGTPYTLCGGLQDNNTWCGPSAIRNKDGIGNDEWFIIGGGDGFVGMVDPSDPNVLYSESQDGRMNRVDRVTNERKSIRPEPVAGQPAYRWNWDTPMALSPHDSAVVFVAANKLFRSSDRGHSWQEVSPDLTRAIDRDERELMGVKGKDVKLAKNDGVGANGTIVSFAESPKKAGVYYTGSDDGVVAVTRDAGKNWARVAARVPGLPEETYVSEVLPSRHDEGTVYATFDGHRSNDFGSYVYASKDFGNSWRSLGADLPKGEVVRTIAEDLKNPDVLYLGTETGLFVSTDAGKSWSRVRANLPTVPVYEIALHPAENDMILATHGRSLWVLDDLQPFQQHAKAAEAAAFLFPPERAVVRNASSERMREFEGDRKFLGKNPPAGAPITYRLKADAKELKLVVKDAAGQLVRELSGDATKDARAAGLNTLVWDLRVPPLPPTRGPQPAAGGGGGGFGGGTNGPIVLPGSYSLSLNVEGREVASTSLQVAGDPEIAISDADRKLHFDTLVALHEMQRQANDAFNAVFTMNEQLTTAKERVKTAGVRDELKKAVDDFDKELSQLKPQLGVGVQPGGGFDPAAAQRNVRQRIGQLKGGVMGSTSRPTEAQVRQTAEGRQALSALFGEVNAVIGKAQKLHQELASANLLMEVPKPLAAPVTSPQGGR